ncbi:hypothetical protein L603_002400000610 [Cellulosimicrobium cellulans J34]|nr:hypothetical protein L603_002400000610 [Cellulosimicrobium cellulans J34]SMF46312.1 hypothetical protein SAMN02744115_03454 [Cellulosimicrobium cellulans J1]
MGEVNPEWHMDPLFKMPRDTARSSDRRSVGDEGD